MSDAFSSEVRDLWTQAEEADSDNRKEALEDLKFEAGEQWDKRTRDYRESSARPFPLPCLTVNQLPQIIGQVVGDRRANSTAIKVLPREDGDKEVAEVRSELIRSIELQSKADRVYTRAFEQAVGCGMGNFRIDLDYAYEDAFERDLFIRSIPNPLSVLWDPMAADPTGRDAGYCFVADRIKRAEYERRFPDAAKTEMFDATGLHEGWFVDDMVRITEYWKLEERDRLIALMMDGSVQDVTDKPEAEWQPLLYVGPDGKRQVRKAKCKYAKMVLTNGIEELGDPFEIKVPRIPIIRVMGREVWIGDRRVRFGLTRFARDPARLRNYWRSVVAELLMGAPRANYMAMASAIKGREKDWPNTLVSNDGAPPPTEITGMNLSAFINEAAMCAQDMKDVTGIHDASLGIKSNETSGVAIQRRQHEGDIATIGYHDNMNAAMQEAGEVLNALIPIVYDTPRTIRVIGEDQAVRLLRVNDPSFNGDPAIGGNIDLAKGRYDVTISTGPAYQSRRQEAAAGMIEFARSDPTVMQKAGDLIAKSQDWPLADEFAERLRPPGATDTEDMTPEQQREAAMAAQQQQQMQAMQQEAVMAEIAKAKAEARKAEADADRAEAEAEKARTEVAEKKAALAVQGAELAGFAADEIEQPQGEQM